MGFGEEMAVALSGVAFLCYGAVPTPSLGFGRTSRVAHGQSDNARTGVDPQRINQLKDLKIATIKANGLSDWRSGLMDNDSVLQKVTMFHRRTSTPTRACCSCFRKCSRVITTSWF